MVRNRIHPTLHPASQTSCKCVALPTTAARSITSMLAILGTCFCATLQSALSIKSTTSAGFMGSCSAIPQAGLLSIVKTYGFACPPALAAAQLCRYPRSQSLSRSRAMASRQPTVPLPVEETGGQGTWLSWIVDTSHEYCLPRDYSMSAGCNLGQRLRFATLIRPCHCQDRLWGWLLCRSSSGPMTTTVDARTGPGIGEPMHRVSNHHVRAPKLARNRRKSCPSAWIAVAACANGVMCAEASETYHLVNDGRGMSAVQPIRIFSMTLPAGQDSGDTALEENP